MWSARPNVSFFQHLQKIISYAYYVWMSPSFLFSTCIFYLRSQLSHYHHHLKFLTISEELQIISGIYLELYNTIDCIIVLNSLLFPASISFDMWLWGSSPWLWVQPCDWLWQLTEADMKCVGSESESLSCSLMSDTLWPHGPTRLLCPWDSPDKNTGVGSLSLLEGIFLTQGSNLGPLYCWKILYHMSTKEAHT